MNPFHNPKIREAVNWLVDRDHVAEEIYGGLAVPRYLPLATTFPDAARLAETVRQLEVKYRHDPIRAAQVITEQMHALGAVKESGLWVHDGKPIKIGILIRIEDERRRVGDYVADLFVNLGFDVERMYRAADEASRLWISGDPYSGAWHIYTGGWVAPFISRDQAGNFNYYYTPRGRPNPLWQSYAPAAEFDELSERLVRRDYRDWAERMQMMRDALRLSMEESTHIWLSDTVSIWPRAKDVTLAVDLAAGMTSSSLWAQTLRYRDRVGGKMKIALPNLLTEPWNPIAGSNWVFDLMIMRGLRAAPVVPNPYTGLHMPQYIASAEVTVQEDVTASSTYDWVTLRRAKQIKVPEDAWIDWDSAEGRWITVGEKHPEGVNTLSVTRLHYEPDYLDGRWHDGSKRSIADVVLPWILTFERADEANPLLDPALVPAFKVFQRTFRGRRIVSQDPLVIEVYSDLVFPDAELIAAVRSPGFRGVSGIADIATPWHTLGLAIRADRTGELAFSSVKADRGGIEWINLVDGPSLSVLERHLGTARATGFLPYPNVLADLVDEGEVESRYQSLTNWYQQRGHFWVGDGPFYLHAVHAVAGSVVLRRFAGYQGLASRWQQYTRPRIPAFDIRGPLVVASHEPAQFKVSISFDGEPYPESDIEQVSFLLFNRTGELVRTGSASSEGGGNWSITIPVEQVAALGVGGNRLEVAVIASPVALPSFGTHGFATVPGAVSLAGGVAQ
jgi:peptide/nickel transport system substrate-binding protein